LCDAYGVRLCLDAVSSIGTIPVDLRHVHLASSVSGKGLRSLAGIALVSHDHPVRPSLRLPRYLDLGLYAAAGVPFTHSSNLIKALGSAMRGVQWPARYAEVADISTWLRTRLRAAGFQVVAAEPHAAPGIVTLSLPGIVESTQLGARLEDFGYRVACHSGYLRDRNWIQISLMASPRVPQLEGLLDALGKICPHAIHC
jgi:aspartate aminotransferase-like enzyme